jgi:hypothetical protein
MARTLSAPSAGYFSKYSAGNFRLVKGRKYENTVTGDLISRRQYDKNYGKLKQENFASYEAKARALAEIRGVTAAQARLPARGRSTASGPSVFRNASPLTNKSSRNIAIPFHLYRGDDPEEFVLDAERFRAGFYTAVRGITSNPKIAAAGIRAEWRNPITGGHGWFTYLKTTRVDTDPDENSFEPDYDEMIEYFYEGSNSNTLGAEIAPLEFHVVFHDEFIPKAKVKGLSTKRAGKKSNVKSAPAPVKKKGKPKRRLIR